MSKQYLFPFIIFLLFINIIQAQPVITAAGLNPSIGQSFNWQNTGLNNVALPDTGGINKIWDYSHLKDSGQVLEYHFISPVGLPYTADSFPTSNIVMWNKTDSSYSYELINNSNWNEVGYTSSKNLYISVNRPPATIFNYPLSYHTTYSDNFTTSSGNKEFNTTIVDGYGTLKLPNATYNNVLRLKRTNIYVSGNFSDTSVSYLFLNNGIHIPLLGISCYLGNGSVILSSIFYLKNYLMPLNITNFRTSLQNNLPSLTWSANNTDNTEGFSIERSNDGKTFSEIGFVEAGTDLNYHFMDPLTPETTVFYRLKQIDKDGKHFYSTIDMLNRVTSQVNYRVYPNPTTDHILINVPANKNYDLKIYTNAGKLVYKNNHFISGQVIPTHSWSNGTYIAHLNNNEIEQTISFEVMNQ